MKSVKVTPYGTITFQSLPTCPECGTPWRDGHRAPGTDHCPGRPQGCTCYHDLQYHREPGGCRTREAWCPCVYRKRPVNWATHNGNYGEENWE